MRRIVVKKDVNERMFLSISTFLIIFLLGLIFPKNVNAGNERKSQNYFYVKAISNTLTLINSSNNGEQNVNSEIKYTVLSFLGIDVLNPISIVVNEIPYLDKIENSSAVKNDSNKEETIFNLTPFNLNDKQVSKSETPNVIANLYNPALKQTPNNVKPRVLIYHSHATEAYRTSDKDTSKKGFNLDLTKNVCAVGDVIENELQKNYGITVIHDETLHNVGDYNSSYKKSRITLQKYLKAYGNFDLIIDLHRDGVSVKNNRVSKSNINGEDVAKFMFVVTRKNPRYAKQKKLVDSMIGISNKLFPSFIDSREIYYHDWGMSGFYNQNESDTAVLIEVGDNNNTIEQVKNTGKYLSRIIAEQLNGKK
ncbi:stage II sporulation protein P [Clostridium estertheticum]|uniref:stage II sporulation protein P n=1 Tax=Clostridium estertheticum TaxID=238834 RepID=UPI0013EED69A|nr:stage II sporulation protein P [Clostridium estertheticum]MBZ9607473.1 stage II sporulation protein P [Clostridium estertheticum]